MTLYGDPDVKFGGQTVGGIRIGALSDLPKPVTVALTVSRGKRAPFTVQPISTPKPKDTSGRDWLVELADAQGDVSAISALGQAATAAHAAQAILATIRAAYHDAKKAGDAPDA
jgi:hypothetical protein